MNKNLCPYKDSVIDREITKSTIRASEACSKAAEDQALIIVRSLTSHSLTCVRCKDKSEAIFRIACNRTRSGTIKTRVWFYRAFRRVLLINLKVSRWTEKHGCRDNSTSKTYLKMKASRAASCRPPVGPTWLSSSSKGKIHGRLVVPTLRARTERTRRLTATSRVSCKSGPMTLRFSTWRQKNC